MATIKVGLEKEALVDDSDYAELARHRWRYNKSKLSDDLGYAYTSIRGKPVLMHRMIMKPPLGFVVDHVNRNGLDNRRQNLRTCSRAENLRNRKTAKSNKCGLKGVYLEEFNRHGNRCSKPWRAQIKVDGTRHNLGSHETKELAYQAYCRAAKLLHGDFHRLT
jgi:hypothetical protein